MGLEMNCDGEEQTAFEIGVVIPKRIVKEEDEKCDCIEVLVKEFRDVGLVVERVLGLTDEFIKVGFLILVSYILTDNLMLSSMIFNTILLYN